MLKVARFFAEQRIELYSNNAGVACFSETVNNILMWGHYADGHRGFCLEFDTRYQPFSKAANVIYSKTYAIMDPGELITEKHSEYKFPALSALITKSDAWKYEREWRIINEQGGISIEFHPAALTGIYFGCKMSAEHMEIIEMILKDYPVKLYEMKQSMTKFKVIAQKYTNESDAVLEVKDWLVRRVHI